MFLSSFVMRFETCTSPGIDPAESAPKYYRTLPIQNTPSHQIIGSTHLSSSAENTRKSRRLMGGDVEETPPLESVEKFWREKKTSNSPTRRAKDESHDREEPSPGESCVRDSRPVDKPRPQKPLLFVRQSSPHKSKPKKKEVWSYTKRRKWRRSYPLSPQKKEVIVQVYHTGEIIYRCIIQVRLYTGVSYR